MIRNYLKIAWRIIVRDKTFSIINILGLTLGMACSLLIGLWVWDELSVDAYHSNGPLLYSVMERNFYDGRIEAGNSTPGPLADELKRQFPEIVHAAGFSPGTGLTFTVGEKVARERGRFAGADWFSMFSIPLLAGTAETALNSPNSIAISRRTAQNYFGQVANALGKPIRINNDNTFRVTAVFEDLPHNSSDKYDFLLNWSDYLSREPWLKQWDNASPQTRIQLRTDANVAALEIKLKGLLRNYDKSLNAAFDTQLFLQPYPETYLHASYRNGLPHGGRIEYVRLMIIIGVFILFIACINFMNLATSRSLNRAREVGIRKVVGAARSGLIGQFMGEALLVTAMALLLSLLLVVGLLPAFNALTDKQITLPMEQPWFWLAMVATAGFAGLLAGSYPALFLSLLKPLNGLKGTLRFGTGARLFREGLVVFQFGLASMLIIGTIIIIRQVDYVKTKNLGYDRENLIALSSVGDLARNYPVFKAELLRKGGTRAVSYLESSPLHITNGTEEVSWPGKKPGASILFTKTAVGYDFVRTMNCKLVQGRDFSPVYALDTTNYLINESAARRIGYRSPIGKPLTLHGKPGVIVGLVKDFHLQSLHTPIEPLIIRLTTDATDKAILINTQPGQTQAALVTIETVYKAFNPRFPFSYSFIDQEYAKLYKSETVVAALTNYFAWLAIFISCLGLLGLITFSAAQRTREIGVRKVLGASVLSIIGLLTKDFLKLILIALTIASPIAWYVMHQWLQNYAYKVDIDWWVFALTGLLAVGIALLTVSFQSIKAALMNPVKSLRSE